MAYRDDTADIRHGLKLRAHDLAQQLYPGGRRAGNKYWPPTTSARKRREGLKDSSICIDISGPTCGRWVDFGDSSAKGDLLDLIAFSEYGCYPPDGRKEAFQWARNWLGLSDPARARAIQDAAANAPAPIEDQTIDQKKKAKGPRAYGWWLRAGKPLEGSHGEAYLRARGVRFEWLKSAPGAIRFVPDLKAPNDQRYPGLLTAMSGQDGRIRAVHRTFLDPHEPKKANLPKSKLMWGDVEGTSIRLSKGESTYSPEKAFEAGHRFGTQVICEGIEDGLTWAMIEPGHRVTAAGNVTNIAKAPLFDCCDRYLIVADNDDKDSSSRADLERALNAIQRRAGGKSVQWTKPALAKDVNELLGHVL